MINDIPDLEQRLKSLPDKPGVYIMRDKDGRIIYIGKAVSLKNRVRQYFRSSANHSPRIQSMIAHIADFEYILTDSEVEALVLECSLIKEYHPKYNVSLRDDKHYPYIKITVNEPYPRIMLARSTEPDGARYFGPYPNSAAVKETIETLKGLFPVRTCKRNLTSKKKERPCLDYYIGQCMAPCQKDIPVEQYADVIRQVCDFLDGRQEDIIDKLKEQMQKAIDALNFEKAAVLRDKINAILSLQEKQKVVSTELIDQDVIGVFQQDEDSMIQIFFIRGGRMIGAEHFLLEDTGHDDVASLLASFMEQFYSGINFIPSEVLLPVRPEDGQTIEEWLSAKKGLRIQLKVPIKGEKHKLVEMAEENAREALERFSLKIKADKQRTQGALEQLAEILGLNQVPWRIEAFDISHIQGTDTVASMVVAEGGRPKNSDYRRFRISTPQNDDFASMAEVVERRYSKGLTEKRELAAKGLDIENGKFSAFPDLILIDGGRGQLNAARQVLMRLGLDYIPIIGLAKENEEIYIPDKPEPLVLPKDSPALQLLQRIRDEAHRFAISYHRSLRGKSALQSVLDNIPGIGDKRRKALMEYFGSIENIKRAGVEELASVEAMNISAAKKVYEYFHSI